jgi:ribonuclease R
VTRKQAGALPTVQEIAAWLAEQDGAPRTTEATQAFGVRGMENRRAFKALYKDARKLGRDGPRTIGGLPPVTMLVIQRISNDGDLIAIPEKWDDPPAPAVIVNPGRQGGALAVGTRILARIEDETGEVTAGASRSAAGPSTSLEPCRQASARH